MKEWNWKESKSKFERTLFELSTDPAQDAERNSKKIAKVPVRKTFEDEEEEDEDEDEDEDER